MKIKLQLAALAIFLSTLNSRLATLHAQGSLTPPGAPAATMKTLAQIEPRTPISSVPFTISVPGSYYLTTNVTTAVSNAIVITASDVTLDLNGFTIASTVASAANGGAAILLQGPANAGLSDITIYHGHIRSGVTNNGSGVYGGSGFGYGISAAAALPFNTRVSGVAISGCQFSGISLGVGDTTVAESCTLRTMGGYGIIASTIKGSVATDCGNYAIYGDQVSDCRGECTGGGSGVRAISSADNCYGSSSTSSGIFGTVVNNCVGISITGIGISAQTASNCYGSSTGSNHGVSANQVNNSYGSSSSGTGVYAYGTAMGCTGVSSTGSGLLAGDTASNCSGTSSGGGTGLSAGDVAMGCRGASVSGTGLSAFIANSCRGTSTSGTALSVTHNINSF